MASAVTAQNASSLVSAADGAAETSARSSMDSVIPPSLNIKPTLDPNDFLKQSSAIANTTYQQYGIPDALSRAQASSSKVASADNFVEEQYRQDELKSVPIDSMNEQVNRLTSMKFRVLPDILARTDILDYNTKLQLANQVMGSLDDNINSIVNEKTKLETAASNRAALKVGEMKTAAQVAKDQADSDAKDLQTRVEMYKDGRASLNDILQKAITMADNNAKRKASTGSSNPFYNPNATGMNAAGFSSMEISQFLHFDAFGQFDVSDSTKLQLQPYLDQRYRDWVAAGKPVGMQNDSLPPGVEGPLGPPTMIRATDKGFVNPFKTAAEAKKASIPWFLQGGLPTANPSDNSATPPAE